MNQELNRLSSIADKIGGKLLPVMKKKELTKEQVYVVVDTPKKAKELKKVLDMFGESTYSPTSIRVASGLCLGYNEYWFSKNINYGNTWHDKIKRTEVSIKELRAILAKEHLKVGDYVVVRGGGIGIIKEVKLNHFVVDIKGFMTTYLGFDNFKRYATPEEIELLGGKKELEVGKWYKYQYLCDGKDDGCLLFNFNGKFSEDSQCGFTHTSIGHKFVKDISIYKKEINQYIEATPQEVESALIKEAKRRGNKYDVYSWNHEQNTLYGNRGNDVGHDILFENGVWSEVKEFDKFAELKEAHKNGAVIQWRREIDGKLVWKDCHENDPPTWRHFNEYRIKPEEKPKTIVLFNIVKGNKCVRQFPISQGNSLKHCGWREVSKEEVEKLLFND